MLWIKNLRRKTAILLIGSLLFFLTSCGDLKGYGISPWPVYKEPASLTFTEVEKETLKKWESEDKQLYKKLQNQVAAWRIVVQVHNKNAKIQGRKVLENLGYDEKLISAMYGSGEGIEVKKIEDSE